MAEMTEIMPIFERYQEELGRFLLQIQTVRVLDHSASERLEFDSHELARLLKNQPSVPKSVLREMRTAMKILRAEAPYLPNEEDAMHDMADRLEMTFDLILLGEDHGDRTPGVPRIL
ncbi:hypothetical protein [Amaricoccus sp.]|uniref:hypothetical protein n=1 Tax=Amaricoccus sp. TaxID=1872485 RepID=UPI001B652130|nr:hypothetical protein [Amaricoccus sp.]MBP7000726.1 hypothetical protein [Amaricoccus sp.]